MALAIPVMMVAFVWICSLFDYRPLDEEPDPEELNGVWYARPNVYTDRTGTLIIRNGRIEYTDFPSLLNLSDGDSTAPVEYRSGVEGVDVRIQPAGYGIEIEGNKLQFVKRWGKYYFRQRASVHLDRCIIYQRSDEEPELRDPYG